MTTIDNESPPGAWKEELKRMPWKFSQNQQVEFALAEIRARGLHQEAAILAHEIQVLKNEVEDLRQAKK